MHVSAVTSTRYVYTNAFTFLSVRQ